jgi:hypothetical protein
MTAAIDTQGPLAGCARKLAKGESEAHVARRLVATANALDGMTRGCGRGLGWTTRHCAIG